MPQTWLIADYMNIAAVECAIPRPVSWTSATGTNETVIKVLLTDAVREIVRRNDWKQLTTSYVLVGSGVEAFALPSDFLRVTSGVNAVYENAPNERACIPVHRDGDWIELKERNWAAVQRYYRLNGSDIEFFRPVPDGGTVTLSYVSKNWRRDSGGSNPADVWANDGDLSLIPGHLLQLGVIWRFRRHQGLQYLDRKVEYEAELARAIADDRPMGRVSFDGRGDIPVNPFNIPVPDFIPPS